MSLKPTKRLNVTNPREFRPRNGLGHRGFVLTILVMSAAAVGCGGSQGGSSAGGEVEVGDPSVGDSAAAARSDRPQEGTAADWEVFRSKVTWAWQEGLDTVPMGEAMVRIGSSFVGTPYVPGTLELAGEEDVVVNLTEFDCVTLVENVLALTRFIRMNDPEVMDSEARAEDLYRGFLREIRYRGGRVDGYPSRLHYFSEWILDNERKGIVRELTQELDGEPDVKAIDFMSLHPSSYRQLADPRNLSSIRETELYLSGLTRYRIPQGEIFRAAPEIRDGDIIAVTSTLEGLDVAHTGLALWKGEELHLLHAPLVGDSVEVSALPLAERIGRIETQDGIRVARPVDPATGPDGTGRP